MKDEIENLATVVMRAASALASVQDADPMLFLLLKSGDVAVMPGDTGDNREAFLTAARFAADDKEAIGAVFVSEVTLTRIAVDEDAAIIGTDSIEGLLMQVERRGAPTEFGFAPFGPSTVDDDGEIDRFVGTWHPVDGETIADSFSFLPTQPLDVDA